MFRTHTCGELTAKQADKKVTLCGWVDSLRVQGKIGFLLLRDRYGITQVFLNNKLSKEYGNLTKESIVQVTGTVKKRPSNQIKKEMPTGGIELNADSVNIINKVSSLPLDLNVESSEETRLKYRYLDLRNPKMQNNLIMRHKIIKAFRDFLDKDGFVEVETPMLAKSTPEGARDYLVPSRNFKKKFYALPQSPQIFKQLLMISGFDKYFQIARCLRDEDLRADRQPEFTQFDMEMSFVTEEDIFSVIEKLIQYVWKNALNEDIKIPFERITYKEAKSKYKTDKPDLRKKDEKFKFAWVTDFPLFEWSEEDKKHVSAHHPFTSIKEEHRKLLKTKDLEKIESRAYDLVLNGWELGSGSIRIHDQELQKEIFSSLGMSEKESRDKFGFLLDALKFAPPHGGIALGLDRIIAIATGNDNIREVIAFPKNQDARDLMMDSPSSVSDKQLKELGLK